jgi:hypothetical protein
MLIESEKKFEQNGLYSMTFKYLSSHKWVYLLIETTDINGWVVIGEAIKFCTIFLEHQWPQPPLGGASLYGILILTFFQSFYSFFRVSSFWNVLIAHQNVQIIFTNKIKQCTKQLKSITWTKCEILTFSHTFSMENTFESIS